MGDEEQRLYEPYVLIGGEWAHVGEGELSGVPLVNGGKAIERLAASVSASFDFGPLAQLAGILFGGCIRRERKALARSRRNNMAVKRYVHGRTQRTRGKR